MTTDPTPSEDPDRGLDVDAAFAEIVRHWEPSPRATAEDPEPEETRGTASSEPDPQRLARLFGVPPEPEHEDPGPDRGAQDAGDQLHDRTGHPDEDDHFVPPPPPPLPSLDPRRRLAWGGLIGTPLVAVLLAGAGIQPPTWVAVVLLVAFVGGFGYLVATMGSGRSGGGWPPDDGAVV